VHRLVYLAAIAGVVHTYWPLTWRVPRYGLILGIVLALRLGRAHARRPPGRRDGDVLAVRPASSEAPR
jgi:DMSO/TMAO reductase YedYZ heme-binding membrane subunit